jgi:hypothetical protein
VPVAGRVDLAIGVLLADCFTSLTYLLEPYPPEPPEGGKCDRVRCQRLTREAGLSVGREVRWARSHPDIGLSA